jgi:hypothetical protein
MGKTDFAEWLKAAHPDFEINEDWEDWKKWGKRAAYAGLAAAATAGAGAVGSRVANAGMDYMTRPAAKQAAPQNSYVAPQQASLQPTKWVVPQGNNQALVYTNGKLTPQQVKEKIKEYQDRNHSNLGGRQYDLTPAPGQQAYLVSFRQ